MRTIKEYSRILCFMALIVAVGCKKGDTNSTVSPQQPTQQLPAVTTAAATAITDAHATCTATLTATGSGGTVLDYGICWDTGHNPTVGMANLTNLSSHSLVVGSTSLQMTGLSGGITYYLRAYATNSAGVAYGNETSFTTPIPAIAVGNSYGGGVIFYVDATGKHGMAMASTGGLHPEPWENGNVTAGTVKFFTTGTAVGTGKANTAAILAAMPPGVGKYTAAQGCHDLNFNTYNDWYLPSKDELTLMKQPGTLWSSSNDGTSNYSAWQQGATGTPVLGYTYSTTNFVPIRSF